MKTLSTLLVLSALLCAHSRAQDLHWQTYGYEWVRCDLSADVDGDGLADAVLGDPLAGIGGVVSVRSGKTGLIIHAITGPAGEEFGNAVVGLGDLNGDGHDEFGFGGDWTELQVHDGQTGAVLNATADAGQEKRLASIGDLNADGFVDVLVAHPGDGPGTVEALSGRWFVDGSLPRVLWTKLGSKSGGRFGEDLTAIADVTGDGIDDVVTGAPEENGVSGLFAYHGQIHCLSGASGAIVWTKRYFASVSTRFGGSISAAGDLNGDGLEDVVAGAPWNDANALDAGALFVLSGAHGGFLVQLYHDQPGDLLGSDVAGVGDVDQDGTPDLLVGLEGDHNALGGTRLYSGATMSLVWQSAGVGFEGDQGTLSGGVDASGDGVPDFLVGSPGGGFGPGRVQLWQAECSGGHVSYCPSAPNSTGQPATLHVNGTPSISGNAMTLEARKCPPTVPGIFFYGTASNQVPFGDGYLCVGGTTTRFTPSVLTDSAGFAFLTPDLSGAPLGSGPNAVSPGDTRYFQFWYRDPDKIGGTGFNLTHGQQITFCP